MTFLKFYYFLGFASYCLANACPKVKGSVTIDLQDLYPESAAWDPTACRLFLSSLYNCTLVEYNPYTNSSKVIDIPGITNQASSNYTEYHGNGIDFDHVSGDIYYTLTSAAAFTTTMDGNYSDANFTGPNHIIRYSSQQKRIISNVDLSPTQAQFQRKTGHLTNGFQDMASNTHGDTFAIVTFGNSIVKIPRGSSAPQLWYAPNQYDETYGFGGIFSHGDTLVVSDTHTAGLVTFNSTASRHRATPVPIRDLPSDLRPLMADGLFAPSKYGGKIGLWSNDYNGTLVIGSGDGWTTAHFLGLVKNDFPETKDGFVVASFDIGESIFMVTEWFQAALPAQPRKKWPIVDITEQVEDFVRKSGVY